MFEAYYWLLFLGIFILGDLVAVPVIYLSVAGTLNIKIILIAVFLSNIISDALLYFLGTKIKKEKVLSWKIFRHHSHWVEKFGENFEKSGLRVLIYSKFIYGIRPVVRILCGTYKLPFIKYMTINIITAVVWISIISLVAFSFKTSVEALSFSLERTEIALAIFVIFVALFDFWLKDYFKKIYKNKFSNSENTKNSNSSSNRDV